MISAKVIFITIARSIFGIILLSIGILSIYTWFSIDWAYRMKEEALVHYDNCTRENNERRQREARFVDMMMKRRATAIDQGRCRGWFQPNICKYREPVYFCREANLTNLYKRVRIYDAFKDFVK